MAKKKEPATRRQTFGAIYRATATGVVLASPLVPVAASMGDAAVGRDLAREAWNAYKIDAKPLAGGVIAHTLDQVVGQKVFNHNGALGRGSLTAWASEIIAAGPAFLTASQSGAVAGVGSYTGAKSGYVPGGGWDFGRMRSYLIAKYGLGAVRKLSSMGVFRSVAAPLKRGLGAAGAAL